LTTISTKEFVLGKLSELDESSLLELYLDFVKKQKQTKELPISLFKYDLPPSELIIKYLKENLGLEISEIAKLLDRNSGAIFTSYKHAVKKFSKRLVPEDSSITIPIDILANRSYSVLENIIVYLHEIKKLKLKEVSVLLNKSPKTVYTTYNRVIKKRGGNS